MGDRGVLPGIRAGAGRGSTAQPQLVCPPPSGTPRVEASHQHQGVASAMVRQVLDQIRVREGTVTAICPFVADYFSRTTAYADLLDSRHPGYPDRATAEAAERKARR
ncbi:GNAT family N-acetyltransferase [Kribbella sp. NBC_01484]|uniref:GNAT family N-acetyltransferase n=1 Tax=Kribbella sp. NBC_01484 TaxID=2903579 RepID=UPI003FA5EE6B